MLRMRSPLRYLKPGKAAEISEGYRAARMSLTSFGGERAANFRRKAVVSIRCAFRCARRLDYRQRREGWHR